MVTFVESDERLAVQALGGDAGALDTLVRRHQSWVFNLALRMMWQRDLAEEAAGDILVKAITQLGTFTGRMLFKAWLHRIAAHHLLHVQKSELEQKFMTFTVLDETLDDIPFENLPDERFSSVSNRVFIEEAKLSCLSAMLLCLDRRQRMAFILGEIFGEKSEVAAVAMEETTANFRQLLARARRDLYHFMQGKCGLVNRLNPCRCAAKAVGLRRQGWFNEKELPFSRDRVADVRDMAPDRLNELQAADRQHAEYYRVQPFLDGPDFATKLQDILSNTNFDTVDTHIEAVSAGYKVW